MSDKDWNPHYIYYARAQGKTPDEMMEHDCRKYRGGCMLGFILWISEQKKAFWEKDRKAFLDRHTIWDLTRWTAFLESVAANR